ncbi:hypothetical protein Ssi02_58300 [Sinosporangium siamense]|uniref:Uncharacterized protein n=1 Tax=Sinosporangium siamense TaxID=1367973 RepID=A0A919VEY5_9ACTN|nr:hypothetical protein Ssi02_58300 [Sinosporangium siamense]
MHIDTADDAVAVAHLHVGAALVIPSEGRLQAVLIELGVHAKKQFDFAGNGIAGHRRPFAAGAMSCHPYAVT